MGASSILMMGFATATDGRATAAEGAADAERRALALEALASRTAPEELVFERTARARAVVVLVAEEEERERVVRTLASFGFLEAPSTWTVISYMTRRSIEGSAKYMLALVKEGRA
jgi:hypothetical protein